MNKKQLIEAIADYPDDAQVVVVGGLAGLIKDGTLSGIDEHNAIVWALSNDPTTIKLEL